MSDGSSRTLLSLWGIKSAVEPQQNAPVDSTASSNFGGAEPSTLELPPKVELPKLDRAKAASEWSSIFSKPKKTEHELAPNEPAIIESQPAQSRQPRRPLDPRNPFRPSFLHVFRISPERLRLIQNESVFASGSTQADDQDSSEKNPSMMVTLRAPSEKLRGVKPKVHSFFAKRATSAGVSKAKSNGNSLRPIVLKHPPWSIEHIRPELSYDVKYHTAIPRRDRSRPNAKSILQNESWATLMSPLPSSNSPSTLLPRLPRRALYSSAQLKALAALSQSKKNGDFLNELISASGVPKPFDRGEFETEMWSAKYAPQSSQAHLLSLEVQKVADWVEAQLKKPRKPRQWPPKRRRRPLDDFVVEDEEDEDDENNVLLVCGPCGSGKTSAVYAAAKSVNAFVFEVNCSTKRTGKELSSLLDGISHNHAVHNAKNCIILIDDGDIVYENEAGGFWTTVAKFAATSRRPVLLTCTDPNRVALSDIGIERITLPMPDLVRVTDTAWTIALSEGFIIPKTEVASVVVLAKGDMRRVLAHLQLWCQMGLGGNPSGQDWYAKDFEFTQQSAQRVISEDTWCPPLMNSLDIQHEAVPLPPVPAISQPDHIDALASASASLSEIDAAFEPYSIERRSVPEETMTNNGSIVLSKWRVPLFDSRTRHSYMTGERPSYLSVLRNVFADEYAHGTSLDSLIAKDIAPYMREIAACDFRRLVVMEQSLAQNQSARGMRMTRRMWAASGIDSRQYMGYSMSSLRVILSTCLPPEVFEAGS